MCLLKLQLGGALNDEARQVVRSLARYQSRFGHLVLMPGSVSNAEPNITAVADTSKYNKNTVWTSLLGECCCQVLCCPAQIA